MINIHITYTSIANENIESIEKARQQVTAYMLLSLNTREAGATQLLTDCPHRLHNNRGWLVKSVG